MYQQFLSPLNPRDKAGWQAVRDLLAQQGIRLDQHLDYTCVVRHASSRIVATGSLFGNTLRCLAVAATEQGSGLLNTIISHLVAVAAESGHHHLFVYTKAETAPFFADLGFYPIVTIDNQISFLENRRNGFSQFLAGLASHQRAGERIAAVVLNANPFSKGHRYLIEQASRQNDWVHVFVVSEDASVFPFSVRWQLVQQGTADLTNVVLHQTGPYLISNATFPSYFQRDSEQVILSQALLDVTLFAKMAQILGINRRYVGEEPFSFVTNHYNQVMAQQLPQHGIELVTIPRHTHNQEPISASSIRVLLQTNQWAEQLVPLVPDSTYRFLVSDAAQPIIEKIKQQVDVRHY